MVEPLRGPGVTPPEPLKKSSKEKMGGNIKLYL